MKHSTPGDLQVARPPERDELKDLPRAPRLIIEISRLLRLRMSQEEQSGVMSQNTARIVLAHLAVKGKMNQLDLVKLTHLKAPTVSILLRRMEEEGFVAREQDPGDRRAMLVTLTEKGRRFDSEHLGRITTNDHLAMHGIEGEDEQRLTALLLRIRDNLRGGGNL